jgi:LysM domain
MITVQNDWIEYAEVQVRAVPARQVAVRGGAACAQRPRIVTERPRTVAPAPAPVARRPVAPPAVSARRQPEPRLRLTRRGRLVLIVLPAVLAGTAALVSLTAPLAQAQPAQPARTIVVGTGDTLWSIALRIAPNADPRDVVADLERVNRLPDAGVQAGERLALPAGLAR